MIKKFPALRLLDGKDISMEERERTDVRGMPWTVSLVFIAFVCAAVV